MKQYKAIIFMAYRNNKGATGGPGGVLYLQKEILGNLYKGIPLFYKFKNSRPFFSRLKGLYLGAFIQVFTRELFHKNYYYICNDIGTAFALACLHKKYSLIYHQQGPILEENFNFKTPLSKRQKKTLTIIEKFAFQCANSVHFPSKGAENMFFHSSFRSTNKDKVTVGMVLPNTILDFKLKQDSPCISGITKESNILTLLSVGTLTCAKGQDQTLEFLEELLKLTNKKIRYILVGEGPLKKDLLQYGKNLEKCYSNFQFCYLPKLNHDDVMKLNAISDIYIMLHRISIFDLATLEAMSQSCAIILSPIGGNIDFNVDNNIIFASPKSYAKSAQVLNQANITQLKEKNNYIFLHYFSPQNFKNYYEALLDSILEV